MRDYGFGPLSFASLEEQYGNWYFIVLESNEKLKIFYFNGSLEKFQRHCNQLIMSVVEQSYRLIHECPRLGVISIGYVPSLFTVNMSNDSFADSIRKDFLKHGIKSYETGSNVLGRICNNRDYFNIYEFRGARYLSFDYSAYLLKQAKCRFERELEKAKIR